MTEACQLCRISEGLPSDGFATLFGTDASITEVLAVTQNFLVILDVAPVTPGHVLIITRSHERSFIRFWQSIPDRVNSIVEAVASTLLQEAGRAAIVCEHGLGPEAKSRAGCVEHAHLHVIPANGLLVSAFRRAGVDFTRTDDLGSMLRKISGHQYLYLRDADTRRYAAVQEGFPSQLVRRLVAQSQGELFWSWRDYLDFSGKIGTKDRVREGFDLYKCLHEKAVFNEVSDTAQPL